MVVYLSLVVALIGALMYLSKAESKVAELGRISFFAGLLAFLLQAANVIHWHWPVR